MNTIHLHVKKPRESAYRAKTIKSVQLLSGPFGVATEFMNEDPGTVAEWPDGTLVIAVVEDGDLDAPLVYVYRAERPAARLLDECAS